MQKYTLMPGKMIQTCRKIVEFIHQKLIPANNVRFCSDLLSKLNEQNIIEIDRSGGILIIFEYLKACVSYYWAYNQNNSPSRDASPITRRIEKKSIDIDEALELSKEILRNSSNKPLSSQLSRPKINPNDSKVFLSQNSIASKSESTRSFYMKDSFELALEERFKEFIKHKTIQNFSALSARICLLDEFEREIRDEIRKKFLTRVIDDEILAEELKKTIAE